MIDDNEDEIEFVAVSLTEMTMQVIDTVIRACQQFNPELLEQYIQIADLKAAEPEDPDSDNMARDVIKLGQVAARALLALNNTMEAEVRSTEIFNKAMVRYMRHRQAENN